MSPGDVTGRDGRVWDECLGLAAEANVLGDSDPCGEEERREETLVLVVFYLSESRLVCLAIANQ